VQFRSFSITSAKMPTDWNVSLCKQFALIRTQGLLILIQIGTVVLLDLVKNVVSSIFFNSFALWLMKFVMHLRSMIRLKRFGEPCFVANVLCKL
jgi:hypothetical protein